MSNQIGRPRLKVEKWMDKTDGLTTYNRRHRCLSCSWFRDVTNDKKLLAQKIYSPIYGEVTVEELAKLDIANHNCEEHKKAIANLRYVAKKVVYSGH